MAAVELVEGLWPVVRCTAPECKARVVWAVTERGAKTMVDADPAPGGNILLVGTVLRGAPLAVVQPVKLAFGRTDLRKSHFATCVKPARFRKGRHGPPS